jgi:hypothetical protein
MTSTYRTIWKWLATNVGIIKHRKEERRMKRDRLEDREGKTIEMKVSSLMKVDLRNKKRRKDH